MNAGRTHVRSVVTSVSAATALVKGPEKSPYSTVSFAALFNIWISCVELDVASADATSRVKSLLLFFLTLKKGSFAYRIPGHKAWDLPSIEDVHANFLCHRLHGSDFLICNHFTKVVIRHVSL